MAEGVHVFENAVVDTEAESLNVELESVGWRLFEEKNLTLVRQERALGAAGGEYDCAMRGASIELFLASDRM